MNKIKDKISSQPLQKKDTDLLSKDDEYSVIQKAIAAGGRKNVDFLLKMGYKMSLADINEDTISSFGEETPLLLACLVGNLNKVAKLINKNTKLVNKCNSRGFSPLHWALIGGNPEVARYLLKNKAVVDIKNIKGEVPLHWAARAGSASLVQLLCSYGAIRNINDQNAHGFTPLHWAAALGHFEVVNLLLQFGARIDIKNNYGASALHWAAYDTSENPSIMNNKNKIIELLITTLNGKQYEKNKTESEINFYNFMGYTPMHWSILSENPELFDFLIKNDGNPFDSVKLQDSPIKLAESLFEKKKDKKLEIILDYLDKY